MIESLSIYFALYTAFLPLSWARENVIKENNKEEKIHLWYYALSIHKFTFSVHKMNFLSVRAYANIVLHDKNTIETICVTNNGHQKLKK